MTIRLHNYNWDNVMTVDLLTSIDYYASLNYLLSLSSQDVFYLIYVYLIYWFLNYDWHRHWGEMQYRNMIDYINRPQWMEIFSVYWSPKPATSFLWEPKGIAVSVTRHDLSQVGSVWDRGGEKGVVKVFHLWLLTYLNLIHSWKAY